MYQANFINKHYGGPGLSDTEQDDVGHIRTHALRMDLGYGITDRLSVSFSIPYVVSRYKGNDPHQLPIDGGDFHGTFQDYRIDLSYQAVRSPLVVTPFVTGVIPSHDYTFFAHSAAGRDLRELFLGVSAGYAFDPVLPNAYVQARYYYSITERALDIWHDHNNVDVQFGYFARPAFAFHAVTLYQHTYGGLSNDQINEAFDNDPTGVLRGAFFHHDQLSADDYFNVGGGLSFTVGGSTDVSLTYLRTLLGRNGHKLDHSFSVGVGWNFSTAQWLRRLAGKRPQATSTP